ncbi:MAG: hypothetical protein ACYSUT_08155 [Planctomycetota bacterium]|jgi:hypothetical protein
MCGFTWRKPKAGNYTVTITQDTGLFMGVIESTQDITVTGEQ